MEKEIKKKSVSKSDAQAKASGRIKNNPQSRSKSKQEKAGESRLETKLENVKIKEELFIHNNTNRAVSDLILANLIVLTAALLSAFIPFFSFALPPLLLIYLGTGLCGFVLNKETGKYCKYEDLFISLKKVVRIFCLAVVKIFIILFWSLFLIVPGIVCMINYSFSGIILYESSDLDVKGILMLSKEMTRGYRWDICFWGLVSLASICAAMSLMMMIVLFFDYFLVVPSYVYIITVLGAGILDFVLLALPMMQLTITDFYILSKSKQVTRRSI